MRSLGPLSEQDLCTGIDQDRSAKVQTTRARRVVLQLDVICHDDMRQHGFQLVRSKETSRAIRRIGHSTVRR